MNGLARMTLALSRIVARAFVFAQRALGLVGAADQLLLHAAHPDPIALVVSACLLAGAQATESIVLAFIDRLMGPHPPAAPVADLEAKRRERDAG